MKQAIRIVILVFVLFAGIQMMAGANSNKFPELFECISQKDDTREKVDCLVSLAKYYRQIDKDSSLLFSDQAYDISKRIGYTAGECDALYRKSQTLDYMGDKKGAVENNKACLEIAELMGDSVRMAKAYFKMAGLIRESANKEPVLNYYHQALHIFMQRRDTSALLAIYNGIGNYYKDISIYDSAAYYYHKSIHYSELIGQTEYLGSIFGNLGMTYSLMGEYENAEKYLQQSLVYDIENQDLNNLPKNYSRLGILAYKKGDFNTALEYYHLSDSTFRLAGDSNGIYEIYINRSVIYRNQGQYELAKDLLDEALVYYREQDYADGMIAIWLGMAWISARQQMIQKAYDYYDSCLVLAGKINDLHRIQETYHDKYLLQFESGNHEEALFTYFQYQHIKDSIFNLEKAEIISELLLKYEKEKDQLDILNLENETLERLKQRNFLLFIVLFLVVFAVFITTFLIYKNRKNRIISSQRIQQLEEEKKYLAARFLVEGQEEERKRVAMELHDNLGVLLSATKMQFTEIRDKNPENQILISKATKFLEQASSDVRKISHNLMPGLLTKLGLYEALEDLFENLDEAENMDAKIEVVGPKDRLPENMEIMIYRMVQEMINNTIKHAGATKIDLTIILQSDELNISYSDNGKGFDVKEMLRKKSMGLQNIRSRVKFLDGLMRIDASPGNGSFYRICIPLNHTNSPDSD